MSANSSNKASTAASDKPRRPRLRWQAAVALPVWVFACFIFAQAFMRAVIAILQQLGIDFSLINSSIIETVGAALIYLLCFGIIVALPWMIMGYRTSRADVGLTRLPSWMDIGLAPAAYVLYLFGSAVTMYVISQLVQGFDASEVQQIGFQDLTKQYEYMLAFMTLVIIAPIAEEAIFRGYLYGKLRKTVPIWGSILITSVLFALLHMQWDGKLIVGINVGLDVFILSVVMCSLREVTGSIWAGILLHMMKNGLAFYILFINPTFLTTIGG
jgi:uncharacterized protein